MNEKKKQFIHHLRSKIDINNTHNILTFGNAVWVKKDPKRIKTFETVQLHIIFRHGFIHGYRLQNNKNILTRHILI